MKKKYLVIIIPILLTSSFISCGINKKLGINNSTQIKSTNVIEAHAEKMFELGRMAIENQGYTLDDEKNIFSRGNGILLPVPDDTGMYWFSLFGTNKDTGEFIFKIEIKCDNNNGNLERFTPIDLNNIAVFDLVKDVIGEALDFSEANEVINESIEKNIVSSKKIIQT